MTCTGCCLTLAPEKDYYFHYFSQEREVKLLLCMEINLLSVCGNETRPMSPCQIPHIAGTSSCQPRTIGCQPMDFLHCWRKKIVFRVRERTGTPLSCKPVAHTYAMLQRFTLCFLQCANKRPSNPIFLLQCQPSLADQQQVQSPGFQVVHASLRMVPGPVLKGEKGLGSFLQEITICLFLLGVAEKLYLSSISIFSLSFCCQPHTRKALSS